MTFLFSVLPFPTTESVQFLFSCSFRNAGQGLRIERQNCGREVCSAFLSFSISFKFINTTSQSLRTSEVVDLYVSRLYSYHDLEMQKIQELQMQNNFFPAEKEESISRVQSSYVQLKFFTILFMSLTELLWGKFPTVSSSMRDDDWQLISQLASAVWCSPGLREEVSSGLKWFGDIRGVVNFLFASRDAKP